MSEDEEIEEKWRRDPLGGVFFGLILIVVASIYLLRNQLPSGEELWWAWAIAGIGFVFLLEVVIRSVKPEYKRPSLGTAVLGVVLIAVGAGIVYRLEEFWPVIIIAVGVLILIYYIRQSV
ncbi:MAG: hypothetical protein ACE5K0_07855 [Candidatus Methanofastidiosia archaeon]